MSNVFLSITHRERDALLTLEVCRAAWRTFNGQTWQGLAGKGLVAFGAAPALTHAGRAANALTRAVEALTPIAGGVERSEPRRHRAIGEAPRAAALPSV